MTRVETPWPHVLVLREPALQQDAFTDAELAIANAFRFPKRREEWLLSRLAAKQLAMQLGIASSPREVSVERPHLVVNGARGEWVVSLSHSAPYAAAAIAREPIGVDVQVVRELSDRATHLFLTDDETVQVQRCSIAHRLLHFWCAKEAAFKRGANEALTLKQTPIALAEERESGLLFDCVETFATGELIVAVTR